MAVKVVMPRVSQTMVEGNLVAWNVKDGEIVKKNDPIADVEGEKINFEIKSPANGILHHMEAAGQTIKVSTIIGYITQPGEEIQKLEEVVPVVDKPEIKPSRAPVKKTEDIIASPSTRRLAKEKGVDLAQVAGSGIDGRITDQDVLEWLNDHQSGSEAGLTVKQVIPLVGMRGAIAHEMVSSLQIAAQLTAMVEMDASELVAWYHQNKAVHNCTYTDLFIKAVSLSLLQHPILNAHTTGEEIHLLEEVNIGLAVALKGGLVVPVIRHVDQLSLTEISQQVRLLVKKSLDGKLAVDEMTGATFTITNMGMYGIDFGTPIINQPQVAIMAIGRIIEKPIVHQGSIVAREMVNISLTYDHRVTDGVPPAEFLQTLADLLLHPATWVF